VNGRESLLCIVYRTFEQIAYDKCKEYLLNYEVIDDEEIQSSVSVDIMNDNDEVDDIDNNDEISHEMSDEIANILLNMEAVTELGAF
jgi:hypothetical protein